MSPSFDAGGWFAATPGIFRRAGDVLLDGRASDSPVERMIILDDAFENADRAVVVLLQAVNAAAGELLPDQTHDRAAPDGLDVWREAMRVIQAHEVWANDGPFIAEHQPDLGPGIADRMQIAATITDEQADTARQVTAQAVSRMNELATPGTVLALPTAPSIAPSVETSADELESFRVRVMRLVCMGSISGLPQVSIPVGTVDGAPIGLSFLGWRGGDEVLLQLASTVAPLVGAAMATESRSE